MLQNHLMKRGKFGGLLALLWACFWVGSVLSADHRDSPSVQLDKNADLNDFYAFTRGENLVLVMTLFPLITPTETPAIYLNPNYLYQFKIDNTGDFVEDLVIQVRAQGLRGNQQVFVYGPGKPEVTGPNANQVLSSPPVQGLFGTVFGEAQLKAFAGVRDDPFFFDVNRLNTIVEHVRRTGQALPFEQPGHDGFAGTNSLAIVIELPKIRVQGPEGKLHLWVTSSKKN